MITYKPFWETLKKKSISTYALINKHGVSSSTINRLRHDEPLSTMTINDLCTVVSTTSFSIFLMQKPKKDILPDLQRLCCKLQFVSSYRIQNIKEAPHDEFIMRRLLFHSFVLKDRQINLPVFISILYFAVL